MKAFLVLVFWIQLSSSWAVPPSPLANADRNNPIVIKVSGLAVQKINTNRKEGYIYSLVSIRNAQTQSRGVGGMVYYLTLRVDETECHVLSRKDWKSCDPRMFHQSVKGECNATLHINNLERIVCLHDYNCSLTPVDPHKVAAICPDCPINLVDLRSKASINNADKALTKYNQDSNNTKYFNLLNVTKYSFQGVFFNAHYLEFTIVETMCSRKQIVNNLSKCKHLAPGVAQFGFCKASVKIINMKEGTTVTCELYKPEQYKDLNNPNLCRLQDTIEKSPKDRREATRDKVSHRIFS